MTKSKDISLSVRLQDYEYDLVVVGHIALDETITQEDKGIVLGGPPSYAMVARRMGLHRVGLVSVIGDDCPIAYLRRLAEGGMDLEGLRKGHYTTRFVNKYDEEGRRSQHVPHIAERINSRDIPSAYWRTKWMHISPVLQEVNPRIIITAKQHNIQVSVDVQGYVRRRNTQQNNIVEACPWRRFPKVAPYIDVLKGDTEELRQLTRKSDLEEAAQSAFNQSKAIVLITDGDRGAYLYRGGTLHHIPPFTPFCVVDRTGCGDVFSVAFIVAYEQTKRPLWSAYFASAAASFNVETLGPHKFPDLVTVEQRFQRFLGKPSNSHHLKLLKEEEEQTSGETPDHPVS
ncbi:MAG: carbohydrate kinase family protein [Promethearchaeota archaeon]